MKQDLCCENPTIIMNPLVPELIAKFGHYYMNGREYRQTSRRPLLYNFPYSTFNPKKLGITTDNMSKYYIVDDSTGEFYDIFMKVPCNHCVLCKNSKVNSFVHRCKLESQCYDSLPWFLTLTYDEEHKPKDGVSVRETQLFLKRLRINLQRKGYVYNLRYVCVGEYGKKTHRPHYHALIWGINSRTSQDYDMVSDIIKSSWSNGNIMRRLVDLSNDRAFYYTAKYLRKDGFVPKGCNPMFCCSSKKNGGIGAHFIDKCTPELRKKLNINFQFLNKWTGKPEKLQFNRYILNRVFPTFSRSVSHDFRQMLRDFSLFYCNLYHRFYEESLKFKPFYEKLLKKYSADYFIPTLRISDIPKAFRYNQKDTVEFCYSLVARLHDFFDKYPSFKPFRQIEDLRNRFLGRLFLYSQPINLQIKAAQCRQQFARAASLEIL